MIQYLLDEYHKTFKESHGLLVTGSGQIVYAWLLSKQTNACSAIAYFVNIHNNNPFQQMIPLTK